MVLLLLCGLLLENKWVTFTYGSSTSFPTSDVLWLTQSREMLSATYLRPTPIPGWALCALAPSSDFGGDLKLLICVQATGMNRRVSYRGKLVTDLSQTPQKRFGLVDVHQLITASCPLEKLLEEPGGHSDLVLKSPHQV